MKTGPGDMLFGTPMSMGRGAALMPIGVPKDMPLISKPSVQRRNGQELFDAALEIEDGGPYGEIFAAVVE